MAGPKDNFLLDGGRDLMLPVNQACGIGNRPGNHILIPRRGTVAAPLTNDQKIFVTVAYTNIEVFRSLVNHKLGGRIGQTWKGFFVGFLPQGDNGVMAFLNQPKDIRVLDKDGNRHTNFNDAIMTHVQLYKRIPWSNLKVQVIHFDPILLQQEEMFAKALVNMFREQENAKRNLHLLLSDFGGVSQAQTSVLPRSGEVGTGNNANERIHSGGYHPMENQLGDVNASNTVMFAFSQFNKPLTSLPRGPAPVSNVFMGQNPFVVGMRPTFPRHELAQATATFPRHEYAQATATFQRQELTQTHTARDPQPEDNTMNSLIRLQTGTLAGPHMPLVPSASHGCESTNGTSGISTERKRRASESQPYSAQKARLESIISNLRVPSNSTGLPSASPTPPENTRQHENQEGE